MVAARGTSAAAISGLVPGLAVRTPPGRGPHTAATHSPGGFWRPRICERCSARRRRRTPIRVGAILLFLRAVMRGSGRTSRTRAPRPPDSPLPPSLYRPPFTGPHVPTSARRGLSCGRAAVARCGCAALPRRPARLAKDARHIPSPSRSYAHLEWLSAGRSRCCRRCNPTSQSARLSPESLAVEQGVDSVPGVARPLTMASTRGRARRRPRGALYRSSGRNRVGLDVPRVLASIHSACGAMEIGLA